MGEAVSVDLEVGAQGQSSSRRARIALDVVVGLFLVWIALSLVVPRTVPRFVFLPKPGAAACESGPVDYERTVIWWSVGC